MAVSGLVIGFGGIIISEGGALHEVIGAFISGGSFVALMGTVLDAFTRPSPSDRS